MSTVEEADRYRTGAYRDLLYAKIGDLLSVIPTFARDTRLWILLKTPVAGMIGARGKARDDNDIFRSPNPHTNGILSSFSTF